MTRPPIVEAKAEATAQLIANHLDEFTTLTDTYLASKGWAKVEVTKETWKQTTKEGQA